MSPDSTVSVCVCVFALPVLRRSGMHRAGSSGLSLSSLDEDNGAGTPQKEVSPTPALGFQTKVS